MPVGIEPAHTIRFESEKESIAAALARFGDGLRQDRRFHEMTHRRCHDPQVVHENFRLK